LRTVLGHLLDHEIVTGSGQVVRTNVGLERLDVRALDVQRVDVAFDALRSMRADDSGLVAAQRSDSGGEPADYCSTRDGAPLDQPARNTGP
jgi:hypothetical protein